MCALLCELYFILPLFFSNRYTIREFEDALDDCQGGLIDNNYDGVHAWDEGVCFYTGSIEGKDGNPGDGVLLHHLADEMCEAYKTCGADGTESLGTSKLNHDMLVLFALGNYHLLNGNCPAARETKNEIVEKMYIPLIQGAMRYAFMIDVLQGGESEIG